jgi:acetylornithine/N-succinyldiaminopimelate aminotransferase
VNDFERIAEREAQFLLNTYARYPLALARGKGVWSYDVDGKRYLDMIGGLGVNALGHAHPRIVKVIRQQVGKAIHFSNLYYNEYQGQLAERLVKLSGLSRAFFSNSGTEAIEAALKLARAHGHAVGGEKKCKLVAVEGSFHGRTFGALSLTGQPKYRHDFEPLLEGVTFVALNDVEALRQAVTDETCALVLEPIQGEGGIRECTPEYLREARSLADRHNVALIFDEIQCGMGRTGALFTYQQCGVAPDMVTLAKPLAAGLPIGALIANDKLASAMGPGKHGTTFGGNPLACRTALEYLSIIEDEKLLEKVQRVGAYLHSQFEELIRKFPGLATEARGRGMMQALQLSVPGKPFLQAAMADGLLINVTQETVIRVLPPFLLEEKHVDRAVKTLSKIMSKQKVAAATA